MGVFLTSLGAAAAGVLSAALLLAAVPARAETTGPGSMTRDDPFTPRRNAVVATGGCSGVLVSDRVVLTAAHCLDARYRSPKPPDAAPARCPGLSDQAGIAGNPWEDPQTWYPAQPGMTVGAGDARKRLRLARKVTEYALPHCADLVLLRIDIAFPYYLARPLPVLTTPPEDPDRMFGGARLRYAGWGVPGDGKPAAHRQTGPVHYWGHNRCFLVGLPPWRSETDRILKGDSGSPLLWQSDGAESVVGILWGAGNADGPRCGAVVPMQPLRHGAYTPTWRPAVPGSESTDIGAWLRTMVPEATVSR